MRVGGPDFGHKPLPIHRHLFTGAWSLPVETVRITVIPDFGHMWSVEGILHKIKRFERKTSSVTAVA